MIFLSFNKICCVKTVFFSFFFFFFFFPSSSSSFFFSTLCVLSEWKQFGCQVIYQHLSVSQYQTDNLHSDICIPNIDININVRIVNPNKVAKSTLKLASKCTIKGRPDVCKTQLYETGTKCKEGKKWSDMGTPMEINKPEQLFVPWPRQHAAFSADSRIIFIWFRLMW